MKITDIEIDEQELNKTEKAGPRKEFIRQHTCNSCDQWATKLVTYQIGDKEQKATRIERYCQRHFDMIIKNVGKP